MKYSLVPCLLLLFLIFCKSNYVKIGGKDSNYIPYYLKVYEADSLFIVGNYKQSLHVLDSLFEIYEPLNMSVYNEYEMYIANLVQLNKKQKIKNRVKKAFSKYGSQIQYFRQDSLLNNALIISKYDDDMIEKFSKKYQSSLDLELRFEIEEILKNDQRYRVGIEKKIDTLLYIDSVNTQKVKFIFEKKGYPGRNKIGDRSYNGRDVNLITFFLHADRKNLIEYFLPLLLKYVKSGECRPDVYATPLDKLLLNSEGKNQKYGTMYKSSNELMPLINSSALDSLRKSIGLPYVNYAVWRYKKKYGIDNI